MGCENPQCTKGRCVACNPGEKKYGAHINRLFFYFFETAQMVKERGSTDVCGAADRKGVLKDVSFRICNDVTGTIQNTRTPCIVLSCSNIVHGSRTIACRKFLPQYWISLRPLGLEWDQFIFRAYIVGIDVLSSCPIKEATIC